MTVSERQPRSRREPVARRSPAVLSIIVLCGIALSACIAFGDPVLWTMGDAEDIHAADKTGGGQSAESSVTFDASAGEEIVIGEYKAISQSDDEKRALNLSLASSAIDGISIDPGQTFSFNEAVGDTENDANYEMAPVVYGSEVQYSRGGGICQVSTALYIAALKADMGIAERHPHSLVTDYAPIGLDATLVYGVMDLKLTNRSDHPIRIEAVSEGQTVTVRLYGHSLGQGVAIDATSKIIERRDAEGNQQEAGGDSSVEATYYVVESYRVYYQNGVKTESEHLGTDTYEVNKSSTVTPTEGGFDPTK